MFDSGSTPPGASDWVVPGVQRVGSLPASEQLLSEELLVLRAAVDAVVGQDLGGLGDREVLAEVKALLAEVARLEVLGLTRLGVVDRLRLHELDGARSTARWVREQGVAASGAQLALARRLEAFPQLAAGLLAGRLGVPAAQTLGAVLARLRPHVDRPDGLIDGQAAEQVLAGVVVDGVRLVVGQARGGFPAVDDPVLVALLVELPAVLSRPQGELARLEAALLVLAEHVEPGQLAGCLAVLVDALLPGQLEDRARGGHDRRGLRLVARHDGRGAGTWPASWTCRAGNGCTRFCRPSSPGTQTTCWTPRPPPGCGSAAWTPTTGIWPTSSPRRCAHAAPLSAATTRSATAWPVTWTLGSGAATTRTRCRSR